MTRAQTLRRSVLFLSLLSPFFLAHASSAETIELVTYYPAPDAGQDRRFGRLHADRVTIGNPFSLTNPAEPNPPNGYLLVADRLGVGTAAPAGPLHVVGVDDAQSNVLFMPGADTGADPGVPEIRVGVGTNTPTVRLDVAQGGAIRLGNAYMSSGGGAGSAWAHFGSNAWYDNANVWQIPDNTKRSALLQMNEDAIHFFQTQTPGGGDWTARMSIVRGGNVGIGTSAPTTPLDVNGQIRMRGGAPNANGGNANAGATQPLFTDANGVASRGWPSGTVIQQVFLVADPLTGTGTPPTPAPNTTSTLLQPLGDSIPITPRSADSTFIVEANFAGYVADNDTTGSNSIAYFRLREVTGGVATNVGTGELTLSASSDNNTPNGIAAHAPCLVRAIVRTTGNATPRLFRLYGRSFSSGAAVKCSAAFIVLTVTEIQN